ncbi:MAG: M10 family metallopeptidase C-terminal domain-containing protein [Zavarzinia sp.]|nr:M10 family metallopeptidase C-terminal domain-containing protein [Zavarzinia sp.]
MPLEHAHAANAPEIALTADEAPDGLYRWYRWDDTPGVDGPAQWVLGTPFIDDVTNTPGTPSDGETGSGGDGEFWIVSYAQTGNARISGTRLADRLSGTASDDEAWGKSGADRIEGRAGHDRLSGGDGDDVIIGGDGADRLEGGRGDDRLSGGAGQDLLSGNTGNDTLNGGDGDDVIIGGGGADRLIGGAGADLFVFQALTDSRATGTGPDRIIDFNREDGDRIELSALASGAVIFIGTERFSGTGPEIGYAVSRHEVVLFGDFDGDGRVDFTLRVHGVEALYASDLVLA